MNVDVLVIGAGIQGAGVAQACAAAGHSVLVVEKSAPAAGTSSKSSKLIHGGLRYLETLQLGLVRESLAERALLLKLAPELVQLKSLHIPIYSDTRRGPLTIGAGLSLYAALAGFNRDARFSRVARGEWDNLSGLATDNLKSVFRYAEAQTDDAALTRAVLQSAASLGAEVRLNTEVINIARHAGQVDVELRSALVDTSVTCKVVVNCAGPWAGELLARVTPPLAVPRVDLVQGSHLLIPARLDHYFYLEAPRDKRAIFVLPYQGRVLLGTTEKTHQGAPETARCSEQERDYLLETLTHYFPNLQFPAEQIESFAGLRVLPASAQTAFKRSRDVMIETDGERPQLVSVMGGKLTTYRATAEQVVAKIAPSLPARAALADTRALRLEPVH